jgi:hypothetical protein
MADVTCRMTNLLGSLLEAELDASGHVAAALADTNALTALLSGVLGDLQAGNAGAAKKNMSASAELLGRLSKSLYAGLSACD